MGTPLRSIQLLIQKFSLEIFTTSEHTWDRASRGISRSTTDVSAGKMSSVSRWPLGGHADAHLHKSFFSTHSIRRGWMTILDRRTSAGSLYQNNLYTNITISRRAFEPRWPLEAPVQAHGPKAWLLC